MFIMCAIKVIVVLKSNDRKGWSVGGLDWLSVMEVMLMETGMDIRNIGLRGVVVASTSIGDVDGSAGRLVYRGYLIKDLAGKASFEEVRLR